MDPKRKIYFFQSWPHGSSHILRQSAASGLRSHSDKISVLVDLVTCFLSFAKTGNGARRPPELAVVLKSDEVEDHSTCQEQEWKNFINYVELRLIFHT